MVDLHAVAQLVRTTGAMRVIKEWSSAECHPLQEPIAADFRAELGWTVSAAADSKESVLRPNFRVFGLPEKAGSVRFDVVLRVPTAAGGTPVKDRVLGSFSAYRADGSNLSPEEYKIGKQTTFSVIVACDFLDGDGKKLGELTVTRTYQQTKAGIEQVDNESGRRFSAAETALAKLLDKEQEKEKAQQ